MKTLLAILFLAILTATSCQFNQSTSVDLTSGLSTKGNGISCDKAHLSVDGKHISRSTFVYGERFYINFNGVNGFVKTGSNIFPGMKLTILDQNKDTILHNDDLYEKYSDEGVKFATPFLMNANIVTAQPMHSGEKYTLFLRIWDKKGSGTFKATMDFDIIANELIEVENTNLKYDEIYLFSEKENKVVVDNTAKLNEKLYIFFEGLEGFKEENGMAELGLKITAIDNAGTEVLNMDDLFYDTPAKVSDINGMVSANIIINSKTVNNPILWTTLIWDKNSDNKIEATVKMNFK